VGKDRIAQEVIAEPGRKGVYIPDKPFDFTSLPRVATKNVSSRVAPASRASAPVRPGERSNEQRRQAK